MSPPLQDLDPEALRENGEVWPDDELAFLASVAKDCRCCPSCGDVPCGGCQAGGLCDDLGCRCFGDEDAHHSIDEPQSSDDLDAEGDLP